MGMLLSIVALFSVSIALTWELISISSERVVKSREVVMQVERENVLRCRKELLTYIFSQKLPYVFDLPVKEVCGNFYFAQKDNCDSYYCDYTIFFGRFRQNAVPVFKITKEQLSLVIEGKNIEKLRKIAEELMKYQKSFDDHTYTNHFLDVGDTSGFKTLSAYSDFFEDKKVSYLDIYAESFGTLSNFSICTSDGADCEVQEDTAPYESIVKYTSPYTGKVKEIRILDK